MVTGVLGLICAVVLGWLLFQRERPPGAKPSLRASPDPVDQSWDARLRDALIACRDNAMGRIRMATRESEKCVHEAADRLGSIVTETEGHAQELNELAGAIGTSDSRRSEGIAAALTAQTEEVGTFAQTLIGRAQQQSKAAQEAAGATSRIVRISRDIQSISTRSRLLTLNARIECTRLGDQGRSLEAVASEMAAMSHEILRANEEIESLARSLGELLPNIARQSEELLDRASDFRRAFEERQESTSQTLGTLLSTVMRTTTSSHERVQRVVRYSQDALSALQFQDPMIQDLAEVEHAFFETAAGEGVDLGEPAPQLRLGALTAREAHVPEETSQASSGEVLLF